MSANSDSSKSRSRGSASKIIVVLCLGLVIGVGAVMTAMHFTQSKPADPVVSDDNAMPTPDPGSEDGSETDEAGEKSKPDPATTEQLASWDPKFHEDTDGDGLGDGWEMRHFKNLYAGPDDDPDGDGMTNLEEYKDGPPYRPTRHETKGNTLTDEQRIELGLQPRKRISVPVHGHPVANP